MILQKMKFPNDLVCNSPAMYFHAEGEAYYTSEKELCLKRGTKCHFDTYFNSLSIDKWRKYTVIDEVYALVRVKGCGRIKAQYKYRVCRDNIPEMVVGSYEVNSEEITEVKVPFPKDAKGMLFLTFESYSETFYVYGGEFVSDVPADKIRPVKIGIGICTFRREKYITKNIGLLNDNIFNNQDSIVNGHLEVFISDNGHTLDQAALASDTIHIVENKNVGGAGGFTRALIEMMAVREKKGITHALLMDDDITIDTEAINRTYAMLALLKEEHKDAFIGGSMLRNDRTFMQVEAGASWNAGRLVSYKQNLPLDNPDACLYNELEERYEFNAWWYCCFPMAVVREDNLPMPIFIRGDDLEYGLRNMKELILLNGICVWHEPFENKYSSFLEYYILRNKLIDNALHFPNYDMKDLIKDLKFEVMRELMLYRYKNVHLVMAGVRDFLKGVDFLLQTDGEQLHKDVMAAGYKAQPLEELGEKFDVSLYEANLFKDDPKYHKPWRLLTYNGACLSPKNGKRILSMNFVNTSNTHRVQRAVYYDIVADKAFVCERDNEEMKRCKQEMKALIKEIKANYPAAKRSYIERQKEVQSLEFWKKYLGI